MEISEIKKKLAAMCGGQRKRATINGHLVSLVCTTVGEKHVLVDGSSFPIWDDNFEMRLAEALLANK